MIIPWKKFSKCLPPAKECLLRYIIKCRENMLHCLKTMNENKMAMLRARIDLQLQQKQQRDYPIIPSNNLCIKIWTKVTNELKWSDNKKVDVQTKTNTTQLNKFIQLHQKTFLEIMRVSPKSRDILIVDSLNIGQQYNQKTFQTMKYMINQYIPEDSEALCLIDEYQSQNYKKQPIQTTDLLCNVLVKLFVALKKDVPLFITINRVNPNNKKVNTVEYSKNIVKYYVSGKIGEETDDVIVVGFYELSKSMTKKCSILSADGYHWHNMGYLNNHKGVICFGYNESFIMHNEIDLSVVRGCWS